MDSPVIMICGRCGWPTDASGIVEMYRSKWKDADLRIKQLEEELKEVTYKWQQAINDSGGRVEMDAVTKSVFESHRLLDENAALREWIDHLEMCSTCREVGWAMCTKGGEDIRRRAGRE